MQPSCRYQFCWECSGDYHTSTQCTRPKVEVAAGSVLAFDELDKQVANHFLAKQVATKGYAQALKDLERTQRPSEASWLKIRAEGWQVLADAQSALAHSAIVMYFVKSAKLEFMFSSQKDITTTLQVKFEEEWTDPGMPTSRTMMKTMATSIRDTRLKLKDYLMLFQTEIIARPIDIATSPSTRRPSSSPRSSRRNSRDFRENAKPIQFLMSLLRNSISPDSISSVMGAGHSSPRNRATVTAFGVDTMTT